MAFTDLGLGIINAGITIGQVFENIFSFIAFYILAPLLVVLFLGLLIYIQIKIIKFYIFMGVTLKKYLDIINNWFELKGKSLFEKFYFGALDRFDNKKRR